jgi:dihydroorotase
VDADGLIALPGLVDLHVREPGYEASETVLTGSRAAAAGGFTTVFAMPNTSPVADTAGVVEQELALGEAAGYVHVQPIGAVTVGQKGERLASSVRWRPRGRACASSATTASASSTRSSCAAHSST